MFKESQEGAGLNQFNKEKIWQNLVCALMKKIESDPKIKDQELWDEYLKDSGMELIDPKKRENLFGAAIKLAREKYTGSQSKTEQAKEEIETAEQEADDIKPVGSDEEKIIQPKI